jgi:hypothetical protein
VNGYKDYKVVFRKAPIPLEPRASASDGASTAQDTPLATQAAELVRYFHEHFHPAQEIAVTSKELTTAMELISQYGAERVRFLVDYAYQRAPETNYRPKFFMGIRSTAAAALAAYGEMRERKVSEAATAACTLCNNNGFISFQRTDGQVFSAQCSHDSRHIEAREQLEDLIRLP